MVDSTHTEARSGTVRRLLALWRLYAKMDLLWMLRDVQTLLFFFVSDTIVIVASVTGMFLLVERFGRIGPWTKDEVIFMLGYGMVVQTLPNLFFNFNVAFISRRIGRGQLDHLLVQPQPMWMALLTEGFAPFSAGLMLVPGVGMMVWTAAQLKLTMTPGWLGLLALNLVASAAIALAYTYLWGSLAFWAPRAAEEINTATWGMLKDLSPFPLDGVAPALLGGLVSAVPVGLLAWYPTRMLLGIDHSAFAPYVTPLAAVAFCGLATWLFRKGLVQYGRTGSQRYLSLGHRS